MKIPDYLTEIHHAVETVIAEIYREHDALLKTRAELAVLTSATDDGYRRADFLAMNPDLDDEGLGTAIYWDKRNFLRSQSSLSTTAARSCGSIWIGPHSGHWQSRPPLPSPTTCPRCRLQCGQSTKC